MMQIVYASGPECNCAASPAYPYHSIECQWAKKQMRAQKVKDAIGRVVDLVLGAGDRK